MRTDYKLLAKQLSSVIQDEKRALPALANASALLYAEVSDVSWAGFYLYTDGRLLLGPFQGKPACISIEIGRGVCGAAAERRESIIVPDVHKFPGHIACDPDSRSEIVIPIIQSGMLLGVLDLDSNKTDSFDEGDRAGLEEIAKILTDRTDFSGITEA